MSGPWEQYQQTPAGDGPWARYQKPTQPTEPDFKPEAPSWWERLGRGGQNTVDRLAQLTVAGGEKLGVYPEGLGDIMTQQMNEERASYDKARGGGFDPVEMVGTIGTQAPLVALPGGKESKLAQVGYGALSGGLSGLLQYDPTNSAAGSVENTARGAAIGAAANPAFRYLGNKAGQAISAVAGRIKGLFARFGGEMSDDVINKAIPELADLPPNVRADLLREAKAQIAQSGELSADQLSRKANLLANEVTPLKSMVTRDPADWTLERNLQKLGQSPDPEMSGIGRELTDVYQHNDAALSRRLTGLGGGKATQEGYGQQVMKSLDDLSEASQAEVGKLYTAIREAKGDDLAFDGRSLKSTLDDLKDNAYSEKLVQSVTNKLRRFGMIGNDGELTTNTLTVAQAEELRKFVNKLPNDFGKRDIIKAIDSDVIEGAGEDAFKAARDAAGKRFAMLENPSTQRALNAYGELTQGKTAQNFIKSQVIDGATQDVKSLISTLSKIEDAGKRAEAMEALRGGVLTHLQSKAINPNSGQFSGAMLNRAMREIGDEKLQLILGGDYQKLQSLARASLDATYQPAYSAVNNSNTAPMLMGLMQRARTIPGVPLLVTDEAQRLAAQSGYQNQLAEALSAAPRTQVPLLPRAREIGQVLSERAVGPGAIASQSALNERRKAADQREKRK